jgi:hypothetical protein
MYCGNNRRNPKVRSGEQVIGTKYDCFRRGVGIGLNLPYDSSYSNRFVPVDERKIYCGTANELPAGYDLLGSNMMCMSKGIGVGKALKAKKVRSGRKKNRKVKRR